MSGGSLEAIDCLFPLAVRGFGGSIALVVNYRHLEDVDERHGARDGLQIEIQVKLERDWSQIHWGQLAFSLVGKPGFNHVESEHISSQQPLIVLLQCVEHLPQ